MTIMELINKNEVIAIFDDIINDSTMPLEVKGFCIGAKNDINRLKIVEERLRGEWIEVDSYSAFGGSEETWLAHGNPIAMYYCSNCKNQAYANDVGEDILSKFCPHCGADMKEAENEA